MRFSSSTCKNSLCNVLFVLCQVSCWVPCHRLLTILGNTIINTFKWNKKNVVSMASTLHVVHNLSSVDSLQVSGSEWTRG